MKNNKTMFKIILSGICLIFLGICVAFLTTLKNNSCLIQFVDDNQEILVEEYSKGEKVICPELPSKKGYNFVGWITDENQEPAKTIVVNGNTKLYAVWESTSIKVSFVLSNNGSFDFIYNNNKLDSLTNVVAVDRYSDVCVDIELNEGYEFSNPTIFVKNENGVSEVNPIRKEDTLSIQVDYLTSNTEILVKNVELNSYMVDYDLDGGVFEDGNSAISKLNYNTVILNNSNSLTVVDSKTSSLYDIKNPTKVGHKFVGWQNIESKTSTIQDLANGNKFTLVAIWERCKYSVTFDFNGGNCPVAYETVEGEFFYGEKLVFPQPTKEGFVFMGWFTKLCEVNKSIDLEKSILYDGDSVPAYNIILYAGWAKRS